MPNPYGTPKRGSQTRPGYSTRAAMAGSSSRSRSAPKKASKPMRRAYSSTPSRPAPSLRAAAKKVMLPRGIPSNARRTGMKRAMSAD